MGLLASLFSGHYNSLERHGPLTEEEGQPDNLSCLVAAGSTLRAVRGSGLRIGTRWICWRGCRGIGGFALGVLAGWLPWALLFFFFSHRVDKRHADARQEDGN